MTRTVAAATSGDKPRLRLTRELIETWFRQFNADYFGGELPVPRLAVSRSSTRLGTMTCKRRTRLLRSEYFDFAIRLSSYYDLTEREYHNVLLHEMIHYYIAYKRMRDTSPHGRVFRSFMERLNRDYGWAIRVSTPVGRERVRGGVPRDKVYTVLAVEMRSGKHLLSVVNRGWAHEMEQMLRRAPEVARHGWYVSTDPYFFGFPVVRSLRGRIVADDVFRRKLAEMEPVGDI